MTRPNLVSLIGKAMARSGFRQRATLIILLSFGFLALMMGMITPWLATQVYLLNEVEQGEQIAASFAHSSRLALLYHSAENVKEPMTRTLSFPGVVYVAIYDEMHYLLREDGALLDGWRPQTEPRSISRRAHIAHETQDYWHILSPVFINNAPDSPLMLVPSPDEYVGYVHVVRSKATLNRLRTTLVVYIVVLTVSASIFTLVILVPAINRLLQPVQELSETLERAGVDSTLIRLPERGPPEIIKMSKAFNRLMGLLEARDKSLREHSQILESEVHLRTQEFLQARDMALSASRHKSEFLAIVSHELRTPLQAIVGYTEGVLTELQTRGESRLVSDLQIVLQATDQLLTLINDILDLAKIEAGRMNLAYEEVNLRDLFEEVRNIIAPLARRFKNEFIVTLEGGKRKPVLDRSRLRQILLNLLSNACKFTQDGKIRLQAKCEENVLVLVVADTGMGISPEDQKYVFEAFRQIDMSITRHHGGTGLGLAICQRLCERMGGFIEVESSLGQGTRFTVTFPLRAKP